MNESFDVRSKVITVNTIRIAAIMLSVLTFVIFSDKYAGTKENSVAIIVIVGIVFLLIWGYKRLFKDIVVKKLALSFDCPMEYKEDGDVNLNYIRELGIFGLYEVKEDGLWDRMMDNCSYIEATSEDKFIGEVSSRPFSLEEIKVVKYIGSGRHRRKQVLLTSYMIELDTNIHSKCTILAYSNNAENIIDFESIDLRHVPATTDEQTGWRILSDRPGRCCNYMQQSKLNDILKQLLDLSHNSLQEEDLVLYITEGKIRLFVPSRKDKFESPLFGWITSKKMQKFYTDLQGMLNMVDILVTWEKDNL